VDLIAHGANVSQVTATTLWAAQKVPGTAVSDAGFGQPGLWARYPLVKDWFES